MSAMGDPAIGHGASSGAFGAGPVGGPAARYERRRAVSTTRLAVGTLACPDCDAPVAPPAAPLSPADPLGCGYCLRTGAVRDFLSLAAPSRPTRVEVRIVDRRATRVPAVSTR
jgi:hypothetical protein